MSDMINYNPIMVQLETIRQSLTNGFTKLNKESKAIVDQIDSLIEEYERIIEDIDEDGLAANAKELDDISVRAVQLLVDVGTDNEGIDSVDAADMLEPVPFGSIIDDKEIDPDYEDSSEED